MTNCAECPIFIETLCFDFGVIMTLKQYKNFLYFIKSKNSIHGTISVKYIIEEF